MNNNFEEFCRRIGQTSQNFNKKLQRGTVSSEEMAEIAQVLDVEYDSISQQITYIPDPTARLKKRTVYLLELENEAVHMFQGILAIAECLYRIKEIDLLRNGEVSS